VSIPKDVPRFPALDHGLSINQNSTQNYNCKSLTLENGARLAGSLFDIINVFGNLTLKPNSVLSNPQSLRINSGGALLMDSASIKPSYVSGQGSTSAGVFFNDGSSISLTNSDITFGQFLSIGQNVNWTINGLNPFFSLFYNDQYTSKINNNSNTVYFDDFTICKGTETSYKGTSSVDFEVSSLIIEPDARFTLESGNGMLIYSRLVLDDEKYEPAGSFINNDIVVIEDEEVFARQYLEDGRWHFVSSPVIGGQSGIFTGIYMKSWDEASYAWDYIVETNVPLNPGTGFEVWSTLGTPTVSYEGTGFVDTDVAIPLTATDNNNDSNIGVGEGWNLVGNPFTSAMDWGTGNDPVAGYNLLGLDNTIYLWNGSQYSSFNPAGDGVGVNGGTRYVPAMQSFFIKANYFSPQITLPATARIHSPQPNYKGGSPLYPQLRLAVKGSGYSDETLIRVIEESTTGFDGLYDGYKLDGIKEAPQLFSFFGDDRFSINTIPAISRDLIVPLGLTSAIQGAFVLEISELENFGESVVFYFEEIKTGLFYEIKEGFSLSLQLGPTDEGHRFNLHFKDADVEGSDDDLPTLKVYSGSGNIFIYSMETGNYEVGVFDVVGQLVFKDKLTGAGLKTIRMDGGTGNYIVKVHNDARVFTTKVFVR